MSQNNGDGRGAKYVVRGLSMQMTEAVGQESGEEREIMVMYVQVQQPHARRSERIRLMFPPGQERELKRLVNLIVTDVE